MSGVDPECHPQPSAYRGKRVCAECFDDRDLADLIESYDEAPGCSFCGRGDAPTAPFDDVAEHIHDRLREFYGKAGDQLPYESREGGFQGWNSDTYDLLTEDVGLELPRDDSGKLLGALIDTIGDDTWCEFDWLMLDPDASLKSSWETFCQIVKHNRRFFFHRVGEARLSHPDERTPAQFFQELGEHVEEQGLIVTVPAPYRLFRARVRKAGEEFTSAADLGPPPPEVATQSNRMNPPGISMFYGADNAALATAETRGQSVSVGQFETTRPARILDLADLPDVPGFFSNADRTRIFTLAFLRDFAELIIQPVPRDDRTQIDYIPTQVFTEFLRDYPFEAGGIDGIRYRSATGEAGANVVLFATPENLVETAPDSEWISLDDQWLRLVSVEQRQAAPSRARAR